MLGSKCQPVLSRQPSPTRHRQATTKTMLGAALVGCESEKRTGKRPCRDETQSGYGHLGRAALLEDTGRAGHFRVVFDVQGRIRAAVQLEWPSAFVRTSDYLSEDGWRRDIQKDRAISPLRVCIQSFITLPSLPTERIS
jgi:hypothetical protein